MSLRSLCVVCLTLSTLMPPAEAATPSLLRRSEGTPDPETQSASAIEAKVKAGCGWNDDETNPSKLAKQIRCVEKAESVYRERMIAEASLRQTAARMAAMSLQVAPQAQATPKPAPPPPGPGPAPASPAADITASTSVATVNAASIPSVGGSASGTISTCGTGGNAPLNSLIRVHREIMTPNTAKDDFGYRLGERFVVYQVTVENLSSDYQYMLEDVSIDFSPSYSSSSDPASPLHGDYRYTASGQDLTLLRGVPEKGQDLDPRNKVLNILKGVGTVAAGVSGLTAFSGVMGGAVAQFNGPFTNAYTTLLPDHTATQLNRLSDSAFISNTVVNKKSARTIAMFIPVDEVLDQSQRKNYFHNPYEYIGLTGGSNLFYTADVCVDGNFIQTVNPAPVLTTASVPTNSTAAASATVTLTGANMVQGDTQLVIGTDSNATTADVITTDGKSGTAVLNLPIGFVLGTTTALLRSHSNPTTTSGTPVTVTAPK